MFAPQLFTGRIFVIGDASYLRAFAEFSSDRWHQRHERTHWNPYIYGGVPSTASIQDSRPQWLPDPLLDAFDGLHRLPGFPPLAIPLLVHLAGMIAMAALARELWGARTGAMTWAGLAWGLLPALLVPLAFGQDSLVMAGCMMPVILLAVHHVCAAITRATRFAAGLGLSLAVACVLLAAHPQMEVLTIPLAAGFAIERAHAHRRWSAFLDLGPAILVGAAMAAAVWWPAYLYAPHSVRGGVSGGMALSEVARWSAKLPDLLSLAWPWAAGFGGRTYWGGLVNTDFPQYAGCVVLALGLWGLRRRDRSGSAATYLAMAGAAATVLALGSRLGPLFQAMHAHVPLWSSFRVAIRVLIIAQLALVLLSARGLEHMWEASRRAPRRVAWVAAGVASVGLLFALLLRVGPVAEAYGWAVREARPAIDPATLEETLRRAAIDLGTRCLLLSSLLAIAVVSVRQTRSSAASRPSAVPIGGLARLAAVALMALDLGSVSLPILVRATGTRERVEKPPIPTIARLAAADPSGRALDLSRERLFSNDWIRWRARSLTGNHPAVTRTREDLARWGLLGTYPVLCALSVRYVGGTGIGPEDSARYERVGSEDGGLPVWRVRQAMPRTSTVPRVTRLADDRSVLRALAAPDFDPRRDVYTTDEGAGGLYPGSPRSRVRWIEDASDRLVLEARADSVAFLVIADTWLPGWRATLDGRRWPIHRVQHLLRGIRIPPGVHRLRLEYEPEGWRWGVAGSRAAWTLWLAGFLAWMAARRIGLPRRTYSAALPGHGR